MSENEKNDILLTIKKYFIIGVISLIFTITATSVAFYYDTKSKLKEHNERIEKLEKTYVREDLIEVKLNYIINDIETLKIDIRRYLENKNNN